MTDVYTPSNTHYWAAPNFVDTEQLAIRCFDPPSYIGVPRHYDPYNPEKQFSAWPTTKPGPSPPTSQYIPSREYSPTYPGDITKYVPFDPESFFYGGSLPSSAEPAQFDPSDPKLHPQDPELLDNECDDHFPADYPPLTSENYHLYGFSKTYPGDYTKFVPMDPENFDPESFFFGGSLPSSAEPAQFDPSDPKLHPQDPELLDNGFDDHFPADYAPLTSENYHLYGFSKTYPGDYTKFVPMDPENFDPESFFVGTKFDSCDPARDPKRLDVSFDDQSPDLKAKVDCSALAGETVGGCVESNGEGDKPINTCDNKFVDNRKGNYRC